MEQYQGEHGRPQHIGVMVRTQLQCDTTIKNPSCTYIHQATI